MQADLMEQKFVGSAEFNLAAAVYARSNTRNHGWLKKKLENVRRLGVLGFVWLITMRLGIVAGNREILPSVNSSSTRKSLSMPSRPRGENVGSRGPSWRQSDRVDLGLWF